MSAKGGAEDAEQLPLFEVCPCGYMGELLEVLEPRPSSKKSKICPACLEVVKCSR